MSKHYQNHIQTLQHRASTVLARENLDALIIHSGQLKKVFLDDLTYPFKTNPHFKHWLPLTNHPNCWLVVNGSDKPTLIFYRPEDFWHKVPDEPTDFWVEYFDIHYMNQLDELAGLLPPDRRNMAYIGEYTEQAEALSIGHQNPDSVLNYLHFHRSTKTEYELDCMRGASAVAVAGHQAAKAAFLAGESEFDINQQYLKACRQGDNQVPYSNIVALNQNAAILHYTQLQTEAFAVDDRYSFLIDAGAEFNGYASDITRTYSAQDDEFADLITALNQQQLEVCEQLKVGQSYVDLHLDMHLRIASLLRQFELVMLPAEDMVESGVTSAFYPHGLGHFLGLQVHDVAGFMQDERGTHIGAPEAHPFLRCTRTIEAGQVFTIEPGVYFIPSLLAKLKQSKHAKVVNWLKVERFMPYGGIRIEDNVIVHENGIENMTRDCGLA